ncbi:BED zinc finger family protein [Hordeum vulgare]|nr:BED zinc finger family protein [Hordeum vulgare]
MSSRTLSSTPSQSPSSPTCRRNMEEQEGDQEAYRSGSSSLISRAQPPPGLSPTSMNISKAYHGRSHDTLMVDFEEVEADEEDIDYEEEEEGEEDEDDEEDDEDDEEGGVDIIDMGSFSEPGRKFLSKVWKEYEPIRVDYLVVAAECKHCARNICAERKHGTSSLRKHLNICKERKKVLRVSG